MHSNFVEEQLDFPLLFNYSYSEQTELCYFLGFLGDAENKFFFSLYRGKNILWSNT